METINATQVRSDWSAVVDSVVREKPVMFKRTRDILFLSDIELLSELLSAYTFNAQVYTEDDGSITVSLDEIDLFENGVNEAEALENLSKAILEYSEDYYADYVYWSRGNRKAHKPYVFKALILNDIEKIGGLIKCRHGET